MTGLIIKGIGGFYYVKTGDLIIECRGKGSFKNDGIKLAVGDIVEVEERDLSAEARKRGIEHEGFITAIHPRKNEFIRPPIVNVDTFAVTFAGKKPEPNLILVDRFLIMAEMHDVEVIIVINKSDLCDREKLDYYRSVYEKHYKVIEVSGKTGEGIAELEKLISGKVACFAGPSGVGKSTIINAIVPKANMETGDISQKTERGKHTTRHVEIFEAEGGGLVYDTPGFTSFEILEADEENLMDFYPEIAEFKGKCYYDNCRHLKEPECAVKKAVRGGIINRIRYDSYVKNLEEIRKNMK